MNTIQLNFNKAVLYCPFPAAFPCPVWDSTGGKAMNLAIEIALWKVGLQTENKPQQRKNKIDHFHNNSFIN